MPHSILKRTICFAIAALSCSDAAVGQDAESIVSGLAKYYASIHSLSCNLKTTAHITKDLDTESETTNALSTSETNFSWNSQGQFFHRRKSSARDREYLTEEVFDGKTFIIAGFDPDMGYLVETSLSPDKDAIKSGISSNSVAFLLGFLRKEFLPDEGASDGMEPLRIAELLQNSGSVKALSADSILWNGDSFAIYVETSLQTDTDAREMVYPTLIEYRVLEYPSVTEPRIVTNVIAELKGYETISNLPIPTKLRISRIISDGIGISGDRQASARTTTEVELSSIRVNELSSTTSFELAMEIPNYTPVNILGSDQLRYYWFEGEILPATDETALKIAQQSLMRPGEVAGVRRYLWILGLLAVALFVVALYMQIHSRGRS